MRCAGGAPPVANGCALRSRYEVAADPSLQPSFGALRWPACVPLVPARDTCPRPLPWHELACRGVRVDPWTEPRAPHPWGPGALVGVPAHLGSSWGHRRMPFASPLAWVRTACRARRVSQHGDRAKALRTLTVAIRRAVETAKRLCPSNYRAERPPRVGGCPYTGDGAEGIFPNNLRAEPSV